MLADRFDDCIRSFVVASSRRGLVRASAAALALAAFGLPDQAEAGRNRNAKRRRRRKKRNRAAPMPFCAGKDDCLEPGIHRCEASGAECFCFATFSPGESTCGVPAITAAVCDACLPAETCVPCGGGIRCVLPCPDPR